MLGRTSATLWLTESTQPPAPRRASKTSDPASFPDMLAGKSDTRPDTGDQRLLPGSGLAAAPSTSTRPTRAAAPRLPVGILLYLVSAGLVATATIGVFFGTGFFLLAHHVEETTAGSGSLDHGTESSRCAPVFSNTSIMMTRESWLKQSCHARLRRQPSRLSPLHRVRQRIRPHSWLGVLCRRRPLERLHRRLKKYRC